MVNPKGTCKLDCNKFDEEPQRTEDDFQVSAESLKEVFGGL